MVSHVSIDCTRNFKQFGIHGPCFQRVWIRTGRGYMEKAGQAGRCRVSEILSLVKNFVVGFSSTSHGGEL